MVPFATPACFAISSMVVLLYPQRCINAAATSRMRSARPCRLFLSSWESRSPLLCCFATFESLRVYKDRREYDHMNESGHKDYLIMSVAARKEKVKSG